MNARGEAYIILSAIVFSVFGIFTRMLAEEIPLLAQVSYRLILAALIYLGVFRWRSYLKISRSELIKLMLAGIVGYGLMVVLGASAYLNTDYGSATTLLQLNTVFVFLLGVMILKERLRKSHVLAVLVTLAGIVMIFRPDFSNLDLGMMLAIGSAICNSIYFIVIRSLKKLDIRARLFYSALFAGAVLLPLSIILERPSPFVSGNVIFLIILTALLNVGAYYLLNRGLDLVEAHIASILAAMQVIFGLLISFFLYREKIGIWDIAGTLAVISSIAILNIGDMNVRNSRNSVSKTI